MKPSSNSATGSSRCALNALTTRAGTAGPGAGPGTWNRLGPVCHSSSTEMPSLNQRDTRLSVAPRVITCATSCHKALAQSKPSSEARAEGLSITTTSPKVAPRMPMPGNPEVRTAKSAWRGYSSTTTGPLGA